jgi:hypothetical protein
MTQHSALPPERWARFDLGQQILQIGAEIQRALKHLRTERLAELRACYERALGLVDLTVQVRDDPNLRRELLLWRGVIAGLYVRPEPDPTAHRQALRVLLQLHPESAKQIAVLGLGSTKV